MPTINIYLPNGLLEKLREAAKKDANSQGRPAPSKIVQKALKKYFGSEVEIKNKEV